MSVNPYMLRVYFSTGHLDVSVVVVITTLKISSPNSLLLSPLCCASGERFRSFDLSKRPCCFYLWCSVWRSQQCVRVPPGLRLTAVHFEPHALCWGRPRDCTLSLSQNSSIFCWPNGECHSWTHAGLSSTTRPWGRCAFNGIDCNKERYCSALAAQLLQRKNRYCSSWVFL